MEDYKWIVIREKDNEMLCERCGEHTPLPIKIRLDTTVAMMNGLLDAIFRGEIS